MVFPMSVGCREKTQLKWLFEGIPRTFSEGRNPLLAAATKYFAGLSNVFLCRYHVVY